MADSQQQAVYQWEETWPQWNSKQLTKGAARGVVNEACAFYKIKRPKVMFGDDPKGYGAWYDPDPHAITIRRASYCNIAVLLHETAHAIEHVRFPESVEEHHGPRWLGIYMWLLVKFGLAPYVALRASARVFKLKWRPATHSSPKGLLR